MTVMGDRKFGVQKKIISIVISVVLPLVCVPAGNVFGNATTTPEQETFPNLPQPRFQNVAPTPGGEAGAEGGGTQGGSTEGGGAQSGSSGSGSSVTGGLGNAVSSAMSNSPSGLIGSAFGVGPGPDGTAAGNAQFGVQAFSSFTAAVLSMLGFSVAVTGPIGLLGFAIAVAIGAMFG